MPHLSPVSKKGQPAAESSSSGSRTCHDELGLDVSLCSPTKSITNEHSRLPTAHHYLQNANFPPPWYLAAVSCGKRYALGFGLRNHQQAPASKRAGMDSPLSGSIAKAININNTCWFPKKK